MAGYSSLSGHGKCFVACVVAAGSAAIIHAACSIAINPVGDAWLILAALTLFSGSFTVKVPSIPATISVSETFVFTAVLLFGTGPATLIVALDGVIITLWQKRRRLHRVLFNATEPAVSIWIAGSVFFLLTDFTPLVQSPSQTVEFSQLAPPVVVLTATYFLLNSSLTAVAVSLEANTPPVVLWKRHFLWLSVNYFGGASVALLLAKNAPGLDPGSPGVVLSALSMILPLLVISYLTFRTAMGRIEDTTVHLTELNSLYLSVIETLATTIDARDHATHGHIRRVQNQAIALAKQLGVTQPQLLRAIEAAALLHDLGKLQVPEHILNKPGRLTDAEFETIKTHSRAGADILSSIEFPYPVVPIVRHHHENWDGTGYPDRIAGTDIPIGARILAVVDCYDALTSTRPYRRALPEVEACGILVGRRGTMYDPVVVDAFISARREAISSEPSQPDIDSDCSAQDPVPAPPETPRETTLTSSAECRRSLCLPDDDRQSQSPVVEASGLPAALLRLAVAIAPADVAVLYIYSERSDELHSTWAVGHGSDTFLHRRVPLAGTVSGWTAINRRIVLDSDPATDLVHAKVTSHSELKSAAAIPIVSANRLFGVITLYSRNQAAFAGLDSAVIEALAPGIAIESGSRQELSRHFWSSPVPSDAGGGHAAIPQEQALGQSMPAHCAESPQRSTAFILVTLPNSAEGRDARGRAVTQAFARRLIAAVSASVRPEDTVLRLSGSEIGVLVPTASLGQMAAIETRIRTAIQALNSESPLPTVEPIRVGFSRRECLVSDLPSLVSQAREVSRPIAPDSPSSAVH